MSHQRYPSHDAVKEPHSVSLKVLRLSRPSLVAQHPLQPPFSSPALHPPPLPASLAYSTYGSINGASTGDAPLPIPSTNPAPFVLSPILNLPPSFGSAYVGETFSCTLCANHDIPDGAPSKTIRDVRIEAEMKTPSSPTPSKLTLLPSSSTTSSSHQPPNPTTTTTSGGGGGGGVDLSPHDTPTLQRILSFDLKEEGNHVLAVTVSYYEASALAGRTRTFRKLYQFVCKPSLIVRTKPGLLPRASSAGGGARRRWVLEAQLENCSEEGIVLEKVGMELEAGLVCEGCNGDDDEEEEEEEEDGGGREKGDVVEGREVAGWKGRRRRRRPVLQPGETEQVCFVVEEEETGKAEEVDGKVVFGVLQIGWRSEMGNRGFLSTGKLGTRLVKPRDKRDEA